MKKVFPIQVEKAMPMAYKVIEWKIHNVCNYSCSFCDDRHKSGSQRWFTLDQYKNYIDKLHDLTNGDPYWFQFTGGEPTLFPKFIELLEYVKSKGAYISLCTNGIRTLRWWEEIKKANLLDLLFVTYHSEQTDQYNHVADVLNIFHNETTRTIGVVTHVYDSLNLAVEAHQYLLDNTGSIINFKAMHIGNYNIYDLYTKEQLTFIQTNNWKLAKLSSTKKQSNINPELLINSTLKFTYNNNIQIKLDPQYLMKTQKNNFEGWECEIGNNSMRIDYDVVYRGVCEVGGIRSLNDENLSFTNDSVICTSKNCFCITDMIATKRLPKHLYPTE